MVFCLPDSRGTNDDIINATPVIMWQTISERLRPYLHQKQQQVPAVDRCPPLAGFIRPSKKKAGVETKTPTWKFSPKLIEAGCFINRKYLVWIGH